MDLPSSYTVCMGVFLGCGKKGCFVRDRDLVCELGLPVYGGSNVLWGSVYGYVEIVQDVVFFLLLP